ncbi:hypothetical protein V8E55_001557 [Tylopilus felleus]
MALRTRALQRVRARVRLFVHVVRHVRRTAHPVVVAVVFLYLLQGLVIGGSPANHLRGNRSVIREKYSQDTPDVMHVVTRLSKGRANAHIKLANWVCRKAGWIHWTCGRHKKTMGSQQQDIQDTFPGRNQSDQAGI